MPFNIAVASGFDVLCHSLESYTALNFDERPRPRTPQERPSYQGANPIADVWAIKALELLSENFVEACEHPDNTVARSNVMLAATYAGVSLSVSGVHLCHGLSYPVSGAVFSGVHPFQVEGYPDHNLLPHGYSVVLHAPAVFRFTGPAKPERHATAAKILAQGRGAHISLADNSDLESAGEPLVHEVLWLMKRLKVPNGLGAIGFDSRDVENLVKGTLPQERVTKLSPRPVGQDELRLLFEEGMKLW